MLINEKAQGVRVDPHLPLGSAADMRGTAACLGWDRLESSMGASEVRGCTSKTFRLLGPVISATGKSLPGVPADPALHLTPTHYLVLLPVGEKWVPGSVFRADFRQGGLVGEC